MYSFLRSHDEQSSTTHGIKNTSDFKHKLVIIGATGVGKSTIINQFMYRRFQTNTQRTTLLCPSTSINWLENGDQSFLTIFDTPGDKKYDADIGKCLKDADCVVIVYDITNKESYHEIESRFIPMIDKHCTRSINHEDRFHVIIVANKQDLRAMNINNQSNKKNDHEIEFVPNDTAKRLIKQHQKSHGQDCYSLEFLEVTACCNSQIEQMFQQCEAKVLGLKKDTKLSRLVTDAVSRFINSRKKRPKSNTNHHYANTYTYYQHKLDYFQKAKVTEISEMFDVKKYHVTKFWQKIASQLEEGNLQDAHGIENEIKDNNNYSDQSDDKSCKYVMQNALVLIICISKYDSDEYDDLKGAVRDMDALKRLWGKFFCFKIMSNDNNSSQNNNKDNTIANKYYVSENDFRLKLTQAKCRLLDSKNNGDNFDGFIFVFSGHGYKDGIVTSDTKKIKMNEIAKSFSAKEIPLFKDKPKIFIVDACRTSRGIIPAFDIDEKEDTRYKVEYRSERDDGNDFKFYHPLSNTLTIYGNTQGYAVSGSEQGGSLLTIMTDYLIQCVMKDKNANKDQKGNGILSRKTFHQLLNPIKIELHKKQGGNQTLEINDTLLGFDLYLNVNPHT